MAPPRRHGEKEISAGLHALALCSGHAPRASDLLAEQGIRIPYSTLNYWAKERFTERYEQVREEVEPKLKAEMADMHQALAKGAGEIEARAVERLREKLDNDEIPGKDLSAVMQRAAIATGIHGDKHLLYSGQPTSIVKRDATEILRALKGKGFEFDLPAQEVPVGGS